MIQRFQSAVMKWLHFRVIVVIVFGFAVPSRQPVCKPWKLGIGTAPQCHRMNLVQQHDDKTLKKD